MDDQLILKNRLKVARAEKGLSQTQLAELVGVSRNTITVKRSAGDVLCLLQGTADYSPPFRCNLPFALLSIMPKFPMTHPARPLIFIKAASFIQPCGCPGGYPG